MFPMLFVGSVGFLACALASLACFLGFLGSLPWPALASLAPWSMLNWLGIAMILKTIIRKSFEKSVEINNNGSKLKSGLGRFLVTSWLILGKFQ